MVLLHLNKEGYTIGNVHWDIGVVHKTKASWVHYSCYFHLSIFMDYLFHTVSYALKIPIASGREIF